MLPMLAFGQLSDDGKPVVTITDADIVGNVTWTSGNVYQLSGFCFVEDGEVLTIEPGTIIKSEDGQGSDATALVVARGGMLLADGTAELPIIFTSIHDDLDNPNDIPFDPVAGRGLWGGVILLGNAVVGDYEMTNEIEGLPAGDPRAQYGGTDDSDNSGILRYVSIRHGGTELEAANEINGLTMGAVGRGTTISHVEVLFNLDDGFEWFGGCPNTDHLIAAFAGDDCFDYDQGFRGSGQFWFAIQTTTDGDRGGEHDGGTENNVAAQPFATPLITNVTYFGRGAENGGQRCFEIRDNAGTGYFNSIFADHGTYGVNIEVSDGEPTDSWDRLLQGQIVFKNNIWWNFGDGNTALEICNGNTTVTDMLFTSGDNLAANPNIVHIDRSVSGLLDPRPLDLAGTGWTGWVDPADPTYDYNPPPDADGYPDAIDILWPTFEAVDYAGAFDPDVPMPSSWTAGWTALDFYGILSQNASCCHVSGDTNHDGYIDPLDVTYFVNWLWKGGEGLPCVEEGDVDGSDSTDPLDLTYLVNYIWKGGNAPASCN